MTDRAMGRYELVRPLARGGMAEVFLARRRAAGVEKLLVVKRIRPERAGDARFLELFVREARLSMSLTHQNIVPVFDFGRTGDQVFLAMERVEGKDLGSSLQRADRKPLPPMVAAFVAAECCQALDYAHTRKRPDGTSLGIVHRDVTPRNVLLSWSGEVKLTDFGIAALAGEDTSKLVGTPAYMAPEQARGEKLDVRTDIYAIGMVLREALTGVRARAGEDRDALVAAAKIGALTEWTGDIPKELIAIADRATAERPDDRYAEAHEMHADLDAFIVSARAGKRGDAPGRQLAAWLTGIWGSARDDDSAALEARDSAAHLVSFMDDAALDAIGTGTERSMLATAAEEMTPLPGPPPKPPEPPAIEPAPVTAPVVEEKRPRIWFVPVLVAAAAVFGIILATRKSPEIVVIDASQQAIDAAIAIDAPKVAADVGEPIDAAPLDAAPIDAAPIDAGPRLRPPTGSGSARTGSGSARTGSGSGSAGSGSAVVIPAVTRKVTINATPWAYFTVDGGPRLQTPKVVELSPGTHKIHFENPVLKVERDTTLDVPADRDISYVEPLGH